MKMFVYRPDGFGQSTYFVMAENEEKALKAIKDNAGNEPWNWDLYEMETYSIGEVSDNQNS